MLNRKQSERVIESGGFLRSILFCALGITALAWQNADAATVDSGAVDLTPEPTTYNIEGTAGNLVFFRAGSTLIKYAPPWPISGRNDCAQLAAPFPHAQVEIRRVETQKPLDFTDDRALVEFAKKQIPKDAEAVECGSLARNPVRIDGKETAELVVSYSFFGRRVRLSTLITQRAAGTELFLFQIATAPHDFKSAHRAFQASLYSITGF